MTTADDYVNAVIGMMPPTLPQRQQIAAELRSHIAERLARGHALSDVLRQLGEPAVLAGSYLSAEPLVSATFGTRVIAKVTDALVVFAVVCSTAFVVVQLAPRDLRSAMMIWGPVVALVGGSLVFGIYTMAAEYRSGQTIGKRLRGIRVVSESGARISAGQAVVRQLPMFMQVYWIDVMFALFTERSQRAFELLSKTRVVRTTGA